MTDKQIIKSLIIHDKGITTCVGCQYTGYADCSDKLLTASLDLIKRQQAEIEKARAEAIKEFVDRMLSYIDVGHLRPPTEICFSDLDVRQIVEKIANEMVGTENG